MFDQPTVDDVNNPVLLVEWLKYGIAMGFCSEPYCAMHDSWPTHLTEDEEIAAGYDPCAHSVRLGSYKDWAVA